MVITLKNIYKYIKKSKVLDNISLTLHSGHVYGLCGYNGCGKTMLMRLVCGLIYPTQGEVLIDGEILGKSFDYVPNTGLLIETPVFLKEYNGFNNLKILAKMKNVVSDENILNTIKRVGLEPDSKKVRKYSLGMKQRLGIATAIMESPELLILDEPTNALDSSGVEVLKEILLAEKKRGALILLACHDSTFLKEVSDTIFFIENGKIIKEEHLNKDGF